MPNPLGKSNGGKQFLDEMDLLAYRKLMLKAQINGTNGGGFK